MLSELLGKFVLRMVFIFIFANGGIVHGQEITEVEIKHINDLAEGILLIRIDDREREIKLLEESGNHKKAKKVKEKVEEQNKRIIYAFEKNYTFSKFCFYPYGDGRAIAKDGNYDSVFIGNDRLDCQVGQNLPIYLLFFEREDLYTVGGFGPSSFILHELTDNSVKRLKKPFPYSFKTEKDGFRFFRIKYDFESGVRRMNRMLEKFLSR